MPAHTMLNGLTQERKKTEFYDMKMVTQTQFLLGSFSKMSECMNKKARNTTLLTDVL